MTKAISFTVHKGSPTEARISGVNVGFMPKQARLGIAHIFERLKAQNADLYRQVSSLDKFTIKISPTESSYAIQIISKKLIISIDKLLPNTGLPLLSSIKVLPSEFTTYFHSQPKVEPKVPSGPGIFSTIFSNIGKWISALANLFKKAKQLNAPIPPEAPPARPVIAEPPVVQAPVPMSPSLPAPVPVVARAPAPVQQPVVQAPVPISLSQPAPAFALAPAPVQQPSGQAAVDEKEDRFENDLTDLFDEVDPNDLEENSSVPVSMPAPAPAEKKKTDEEFFDAIGSPALSEKDSDSDGDAQFFDCEVPTAPSMAVPPDALPAAPLPSPPISASVQSSDSPEPAQEIVETRSELEIHWELLRNLCRASFCNTEVDVYGEEFPINFGIYLFDHFLPTKSMKSCKWNSSTGEFEIVFNEEKQIPIKILPPGITDPELKNMLGKTFRIAPVFKGKVNFGDGSFEFYSGMLTLSWETTTTIMWVPVTKTWTVNLTRISANKKNSKSVMLKGTLLGLSSEAPQSAQDFVKLIEVNPAQVSKQ